MASWEGRTSRITRPPIAEINRMAGELEARGEQLINLGQAVLGLPPPKSALMAVRKYLDETSVCGYSPDPGLPHILDKLVQFLDEWKGISGAAREQLLLTAGANQAFVNALLAITQIGDEVIFFGPNYFDHVFAMELAGCIPVEVEMRRTQGRYVADIEEVRCRISKRTRALVLVSPGNPTGSLIPKEQVEELTRLCKEHDIWLISDETYDLLTFPPHVHVSPASLGIHDKVVVVGSFSKSFGLAGWRVGYLFGPLAMVEETIKVQDTIVVCASVPSQYAVLGALEETLSYRSKALEALEERLEALLAVVDASTLLSGYRPDGGTFLLADILGPQSSVDFSKTLLKECGIITVPGSAFGQFGEGRVRLSFGNQSVEVIQEAGRRLANWERELG